jgi:N-methylhydantoinase A
MPIFAFGGAGPVHAYGVARILHSERVIYPLGAGVASAIGFLTAPLSLDYIRSRPGPLAELDWTEIGRIVAEMEAEGLEVLSRTIAPEQVSFRRFADMRYRKQGYEIRVPIPSGPLNRGRVDQIAANFEETYRSLYGHIMAGTPIDVVSWRVVAQGPKPDFSLPRSEFGPSGLQAAVKGKREIYLPDTAGFGPVPVYDRYLLRPGMKFDAPVVIEERESTVVISGPARVRVDESNNLLADLTH